MKNLINKDGRYTRYRTWTNQGQNPLNFGSGPRIHRVRQTNQWMLDE